MFGLILNGRRTYAYFSDSEISNKTFAAGTLGLNMESTQLFDIGKVDTDFNVIESNEDNNRDYGEHIQVEFYPMHLN